MRAIAHIAYVPGVFLNADLDKASEDNERQAFTLELADGRKLGVVQIAGLVARRIVKFVSEGDMLTAGSASASSASAAALMYICRRASTRSSSSASVPSPAKPFSPISPRGEAERAGRRN